MKSKRSKYIKIAVRAISVALALFGLISASFMLWAVSNEIESRSILVRAAIIALVIALPVLFIASAILLVKQWSQRAIQLFSLLLSLVLTSSLVQMTLSLMDATLPLANRVGNLVWVMSSFALLVLIYATIQKLLVATTAPET